MIVLLKWREDTVYAEARADDVDVHAVLNDRAELEERLKRIAKANPQYPLREIVEGRLWKIGPHEDEGFFGNTPMVFKAVEK